MNVIYKYANEAANGAMKFESWNGGAANEITQTRIEKMIFFSFLKY